jgi:hypothetical protein
MFQKKSKKGFEKNIDTINVLSKIVSRLSSKKGFSSFKLATLNIQL